MFFEFSVFGFISQRRRRRRGAQKHTRKFQKLSQVCITLRVDGCGKNPRCVRCEENKKYRI